MNHKSALSLDSPEWAGAARQFSVLLSSTRRGARLARLLSSGQLRSWDIPHETPVQVIAELTANAALHGCVRGRDFRLAFAVSDSGTLRIEVTDTRGDSPPPTEGLAEQPSAAGAESGRGLLIVGALADRWGVTLGPEPRKTVWAELSLRAQPRPLPPTPDHGFVRRHRPRQGPGQVGMP